MVVFAPSARVTGAHEVEGAEVLVRTAFSAIALGHWPEATEAAEECVAVAEAAGQAEMLALGRAAAGIVAAVRGEASAARSLLTTSERAATGRALRGLLDVVQLGRGIEALTADRYDEAWAQLHPLVEPDHGSSTWVRLVAVGFLAEAGLHGGNALTAETVLETVQGLASTPMHRGTTAYARALVGRDLADDTTFARALAECPVERAFDRSRINLARGVCLRRERRVTLSRLPLHEALVVFERLGARPWADQARSELRATGARRLRRDVGDVETLTAQELQIVGMAAAGLTNREIGQRLYLSHRTIGSHLYRAYPKLGIAARSQLRDVLAGPADRTAPRERAAR